MCCAGGQAASGSCRSLSRRARSWSRSTRADPGSATTSFSPNCSSASCAAARRASFRRCTGRLRSGTPSTGTWSRRSATPRRGRTGIWRFASSSDHRLDLVLDGQGGTVRELVAGFPAGPHCPAPHCPAPELSGTALSGTAPFDPELAALMASDQLTGGSLAAAERLLGLASEGVGIGARGPARALRGHARHRGAVRRRCPR